MNTVIVYLIMRANNFVVVSVTSDNSPFKEYKLTNKNRQLNEQTDEQTLTCGVLDFPVYRCYQ